MKITIQALHRYLATNSNWIYNQFINFSEFDYLIFANSIQDPEKFPVENNKLYYFPKLAVGKLPLLKHIYRGIVYKLIVKSGLDNRYFYRVAKNKNVSLIHAHFAFNGYKYIPLARRLNVPLIVSFYGYDYDYLPKQNPKWLEKYQQLFNFADAFICEGNFGKKKLIEKGCPKDKIYVNHLGVAVDKIPYKIRKWRFGDKIKFCQIASLDEKKGHQFTIKAFSKFTEEYSDAELTIVGNGPKQKELVGLINELGIRETVKLKEFIPYSELYSELLKHHIFIHPSVTTERCDCEGGAPIILLDAQSTGMPIISTYHCDIPEEVVDGKSGYLVPERDIDGLTNVMLRFVDNPSLFEKFGANGRKHVKENYNIRDCSSSLEEIYHRVIHDYPC